MKKSLLSVLTILLMIGVSHSQTITMTVDGTKQGKFKGESIKAKFAGKIDITGFIQEITAPRDAATGVATGKRNHLPFTILKPSGASSPQFFTAITTNELLKTVMIEFYKPDPAGTGTEVVAYTILLENATVTGYKQFVGPLDNERFNPGNNILYDEIKLSYQKITVEDKIAKTEAADSNTMRSN